MKKTALPVVAFVATVFQIAFSAFVPLKAEDEGIKSNLIDGVNNPMEGFQPQQGKASEIEHPYTVEISRYYLKFQTSGFPPHLIQLTSKETEGIQKLSLAFVELLTNSKLSHGTGEEDTSIPINWKELNPIITLTNSGLTVKFENESSKEEGLVDTTESEKIIVWDFLTKYANNVFNKKIKEFNINEKDAIILDSEKEDTNTNQTNTNFKMFVDTVWKIMRFSIDYAETNFGRWIQPESETTAEKMRGESKDKRTISTFLEYEESAPYHQFPAMEFEKTIRDAGSIFYGRGII